MKRKLWQSNRYIPLFGYKFFYKRFFLLKIAKPLSLPCYKRWKHQRNVKDRKLGKKNGRKRNPNFAKFMFIKLAKRDGERCQLCGQTDMLTVDHIVPLHKHGSNGLSNLQLLCVPCHGEKTRQENKQTAYEKVYRNGIMGELV